MKLFCSEHCSHLANEIAVRFTFVTVINSNLVNGPSVVIRDHDPVVGVDKQNLASSFSRIHSNLGGDHVIDSVLLHRLGQGISASLVHLKQNCLAVMQFFVVLGFNHCGSHVDNVVA